ncbi:MAG: CoA-binding protein [Deltaproteobacteria bacterium]|nr:CoA-binding protein [Deltaproteobacteria bacterium]
MTTCESLKTFLNPESVAVIGATERPGSWGSFIMGGLLSGPFPGPIYPVNQQAEQVFGVPAFNKVGEIPGPVELAVFTIPEAAVEQTVKECGEKGVRGMIIVSAGFGEAVEGGKQRETELVRLARSYGMRLMGPNVSGNFNLYAGFNASAAPEGFLIKTPIAAVCQGSYAIYDLLAHGYSRNMGVGQFVHTGNESDLTTTDFLEYIGADPNIQGIIMYIEGIKDGGRFIEVARQVSRIKPVIVYKAGKTMDASRAAQSHTGALAGSYPVYEGAIKQANLINCPTMELLLPLGQALVERPIMKGKRVVIMTMGGSWGVALSDALEAEGLCVPVLSPGLQTKLRELGMPIRASVKNPVDIGASGLFSEMDILKSLGREILNSGEADALILHGMGRPGMLSESTPDSMRFFLEINKNIVREYAKMEKIFQIPVLIGSIYSPRESQLVFDLNQEGIRTYDRLDETAQILSRLAGYWDRARRSD